MLRTTLSFLKKACLSLALAPRVLRGDAKHTLGKFQKFSVIVLKKAEKSTKSYKDDEAECEKCKKLIELIFGPSTPPDTIPGISKAKVPEADLQINASKDKVIPPHVLENPETVSIKDAVYSATSRKEHDKKKILDNVGNAPMDVQLHATTAKQTEEQLAQKVEILKETPLVEAEKPVIDGFNAPPRVLGAADAYSFHNYDSRKIDDCEYVVQNSNAEETQRLEEIRRVEELLSKEIERPEFKLPMSNFSSDLHNSKSGASAETNLPYDEIAKRCLDAPSNKIDDRILKEIEKLGVPQSSPRGESSVIEEKIFQIDGLKKPRKPVQKTEIDLEAREFERDPPIAYVNKIHPSFQMANDSRTIAEDDVDSTALKSERIQLYELDKKPLTYSEHTAVAHEMEMDAHEHTMKVEPRPIYDPNQVIIDPYDKKTLIYEKCEEEYDPLWYERYSNLQRAENFDVESEETENRSATRLLAANCSSQPVQSPATTSPTFKQREETEPYIVFETNPSNDARDVWQFSEPQPPSTKTNPERPPSEIKLSTNPDPPKSIPAEQAMKTYQLVCQPDTTTMKNKSTCFPFYTPVPEPTIPADAAKLSKKGFQYSAPSENSNDAFRLSNTQEPAEDNDQYPTPAEPAKETFQFSKPQEIAKEDYQYSTPHDTAKEFFGYTPREETGKPSEVPIAKADVTYIERTTEDNEHKTVQNNPAITPEQISHSFVQPQSMVSPLVDSQTLAEPSDEIQKSMAAACAPLPKLKPNENESLSEMLKRVRLRNHMQYCQAFERQMEPETGKCGKKPPPCPPPAPKCPPCPPPACPPSPPPCPKPCQPACPPPCPPPCPSPEKKNPCQKCKGHFSGINMKNYITVFLQSENYVQKPDYAPNLCVHISEGSRAMLAKEISLKLQEIGLNLLNTYPSKIAISITSTFNSENITLAKDYEPWVPIPSWPIPRKEKPKPFVCPKDGCKLIPPPKLRPPCNENPCIQFPKRSNFTIAKLLSFSIGDFNVLDR